MMIQSTDTRVAMRFDFARVGDITGTLNADSKSFLEWGLYMYAISYPAGTWRNNNVIITTSRRRFDAIITSLLRRVPTGYRRTDK